MGCTAALQAIQEAVCQQRYNYQLWIALSRACVSLATTLRSCVQEHKNYETGKGHSEVYLKEPSVEIVKKAIVLMKPHFTVRHIKEEMKSEAMLRAATTLAATASEDTLWIIDVLGMAVTDDSNHWCVIKLADGEVFHLFLTILSCGSCLWARYDSASMGGDLSLGGDLLLSGGLSMGCDLSLGGDLI